jgi:diaminohydroxyphosphoribosylaminopyrimidine deaminase/5-amino-6-(5-phosphoribosylamino)uracil reductase
MHSNHEQYMQRCLQLAGLGSGQVAPNPMVGSVLVHNNRIIGEGYHQQFGEAHAEVNCIRSVAADETHLIAESTLYVSLEPCDHQGKTPPCTDLILQHQISKVVIGCKDISAKVNGRGIDHLRRQGVEVTESVLEKECLYMNRRFFNFEQNKQPYIILKWAETADGLIAGDSGKTKISNPFSDRIVHQWRAEESAIMVGYRTALTDDPQLNVRLAQGSDPVRIVFDKYLSLPSSLKLFDQSRPTLLFNYREDKKLGNIEYIRISESGSVQQIASHLYERKLLSLLIEGGSCLLQSFIDIGCWNEARIIKSEQFLYSGVEAPKLKNAQYSHQEKVSNDIHYYHLNPAFQL